MGLLLASLGCGVSEAEFILDADRDPCLGDIPVCQTTAGCTLTETTYLEGYFPGRQKFVVTTPAETTIEVRIFFKTMQHPGEDTEIRWYEPGCTSYDIYESRAEDIFKKAGSDRVFSQARQVHRKGDHLIEIYSDATTHCFIRVELSH